MRVDAHGSVEGEKKHQDGFEHPEIGQQNAAEKQQQTDRQIDMDVSFFMGIEPSGNKKPNLVKNPRTGEHNARDQRRFDPDHKRLLHLEGLSVDPSRLPNLQIHQFDLNGSQGDRKRLGNQHTVEAANQVFIARFVRPFLHDLKSAGIFFLKTRNRRFNPIGQC